MPRPTDSRRQEGLLWYIGSHAVGPTDRTFRVFVSSTFGDFGPERDALHAHIGPALTRLCAEHGFHLQLIDLRWGISEAAAREHSTMQVCLEVVS